MAQDLTSKTLVRLPDGTLVPVSSIYHAGTEKQTVETHLSQQQWESIAQTLMRQISHQP